MIYPITPPPPNHNPTIASSYSPKTPYAYYQSIFNLNSYYYPTITIILLLFPQSHSIINPSSIIIDAIHQFNAPTQVSPISTIKIYSFIAITQFSHCLVNLSHSHNEILIYPTPF